MSGGSYDYAYMKISDLACDIRERRGARKGNAQAMAFADHLDAVARAAKAIEWNDSGDGDEREEALIDAVLKKGAALDVATKNAKAALEELERELKKVEDK